MRNLFEPEAVQEVMSRIEQLKPTSQRQWGKMDVAQMMAHCSAALEMASGKLVAKRTLLGRIVGPRVRHVLMDDCISSMREANHNVQAILTHSLARSRLWNGARACTNT